MPSLVKSLVTVPIGKRSKLKRKSMNSFEASAKRTLLVFVSINSFRLTFGSDEDDAIFHCFGINLKYVYQRKRCVSVYIFLRSHICYFGLKQKRVLENSNEIIVSGF